MSADNRTVATDALATLGTIIGEGERRDAIHLAVEPAVAAQRLERGWHVGFLRDGKVGLCSNPVGIVDPFLEREVKPGERFWLVVYPRRITSLRHVWTHPDFPEEPAAPGAAVAAAPDPTEERRRASEAWLRDFVARSDCPDYETVLNAATGQHHLNADPADEYYGSRNDGDCLFFGGRDAHGEIPPEFWDHVSVVSGVEVPPERRANWFGCSC